MGASRHEPRRPRCEGRSKHASQRDGAWPFRWCLAPSLEDGSGDPIEEHPASADSEGGEHHDIFDPSCKQIGFWLVQEEVAIPGYYPQHGEEGYRIAHFIASLVFQADILRQEWGRG
jgi:hypothetical protein